MELFQKRVASFFPNNNRPKDCNQEDGKKNSEAKNIEQRSARSFFTFGKQTVKPSEGSADTHQPNAESSSTTSNESDTLQASNPKNASSQLKSFNSSQFTPGNSSSKPSFPKSVVTPEGGNSQQNILGNAVNKNGLFANAFSQSKNTSAPISEPKKRNENAMLAENAKKQKLDDGRPATKFGFSSTFGRSPQNGATSHNTFLQNPSLPKNQTTTSTDTNKKDTSNSQEVRANTQPKVVAAVSSEPTKRGPEMNKGSFFSSQGNFRARETPSFSFGQNFQKKAASEQTNTAADTNEKQNSNSQEIQRNTQPTAVVPAKALSEPTKKGPEVNKASFFSSQGPSRARDTPSFSFGESFQKRAGNDNKKIPETNAGFKKSTDESLGEKNGMFFQHSKVGSSQPEKAGNPKQKSLSFSGQEDDQIKMDELHRMTSGVEKQASTETPLESASKVMDLRSAVQCPTENELPRKQTVATPHNKMLVGAQNNSPSATKLDQGSEHQSGKTSQFGSRFGMFGANRQSGGGTELDRSKNPLQIAKKSHSSEEASQNSFLQDKTAKTNLLSSFPTKTTLGLKPSASIVRENESDPRDEIQQTGTGVPDKASHIASNTPDAVFKFGQNSDRQEQNFLIVPKEEEIEDNNQSSFSWGRSDTKKQQQKSVDRYQGLHDVFWPKIQQCQDIMTCCFAELIDIRLTLAETHSSLFQHDLHDELDHKLTTSIETMKDLLQKYKNCPSS